MGIAGQRSFFMTFPEEIRRDAFIPDPPSCLTKNKNKIIITQYRNSSNFQTLQPLQPLQTFKLFKHSNSFNPSNFQTFQTLQTLQTFKPVKLYNFGLLTLQRGLIEGIEGVQRGFREV
jgi:hypothetical protein